MQALVVLQDAYESSDQAQVLRGWKLFLLTPRMLLATTTYRGTEGRRYLEGRVRRWQAGEWTQLLQEARAVQGRGTRADLNPAEARELRMEQACRQVQLGNPSRARQTLTASPIAPGDGDTHQQLTDPERRPPQLLRPLPDGVREFAPAQLLHLDAIRFLGALRSAKRGSAPGPSGMRAERLKPLLEQERGMEVLSYAA